VNSDEATIVVIDALDALHVPYMVVGSFSTNFYGVARATHDADIVVQLQPGDIHKLAKHLGPPFRLDPQMSFESVTATRRYVFNVGDSPFSVELFLLSDDAHDCERFARRRRAKVSGRDVFVPSPEDVVITKLRWLHAMSRRKDIDDLEHVIAVQADQIDWPYVYSWCNRHGTRELLDKVRQSLRRI
jgi:hypothetical protein